MNTAAYLPVILLYLCAVYTVLGLLCGAAERVAALLAVTPPDSASLDTGDRPRVCFGYVDLVPQLG